MYRDSSHPTHRMVLVFTKSIWHRISSDGTSNVSFSILSHHVPSKVPRSNAMSRHSCHMSFSHFRSFGLFPYFKRLYCSTKNLCGVVSSDSIAVCTGHVYSLTLAYLAFASHSLRLCFRSSQLHLPSLDSIFGAIPSIRGPPRTSAGGKSLQ